MQPRRDEEISLQETQKIAESIYAWTDSNHPEVKKSDGGNFMKALDSGAKAMRSNIEFVDVFKIQ